jgi:hypothetical protein
MSFAGSHIAVGVVVILLLMVMVVVILMRMLVVGIAGVIVSLDWDRGGSDLY